MNSKMFYKKLIRFLLISAGVYCVCFGQFLLMYDYICGWNCGVGFKLGDETFPDKQILKIFPDTNKYLQCRSVTLNFEDDRSVVLLYGSNQKYVGCEFNDPNMYYSYNEFKEMNDSIRSILKPFEFKEYLYLDYSRMAVEVKEHTVFWWYAFRTFYLSLVKKPYLTIFPIVFIFSFFLWDNPERWLGRHRRKESTDSLPHET